MKRQEHLESSNAPQSPKHRWRRSAKFIWIAALAWGAPSCGASSDGGTDTKTNWLEQCDDDADCDDGLSCLCGTCNIECDSSSSCEELDGAAACFPVDGCDEVARVCDLPAGEQTDGTSSETETTDTEATDGVSSSENTDGSETATDEASETDSAVSETDTVTDVEATDTATDVEGTDVPLMPCDRPIEEYDVLGEECNLVDFDCENVYYDDCGCGCDDESEPLCRTDVEYVGLGTECGLIDYSCDEGTQPFSDDCGCGCEPVDAMCRPDDDYVALADDCQVIRFTCEAGESYFSDSCGCGCEPSSAECEEEGKRYVADDLETCALILFGCEEGEQPFTDDCGCGCMIGPTTEECAAPDGVDVETTVLASLECGFAPPESQLVETAEEYENLANQCGAFSDTPEFAAGHRVYVAFIPERPIVTFLHAVNTGAEIVVGVEAPAYCGGAAPPTSMLTLDLDDDSTTPVRLDVCYTGECGDILPP